MRRQIQVHKRLKRQVYLSIVKGDQILMLNSDWTTDIVELKVINQLLWDTMVILLLRGFRVSASLE